MYFIRFKFRTLYYSNIIPGRDYKAYKVDGSPDITKYHFMNESGESMSVNSRQKGLYCLIGITGGCS